jgi:purine-binding chemotaxis protein CheW
MEAARSRPPSPGAKLIVMGINGQKFAVDIMPIREIRGWTPSPQQASAA